MSKWLIAAEKSIMLILLYNSEFLPSLIWSLEYFKNKTFIFLSLAQ